MTYKNYRLKTDFFLLVEIYKRASGFAEGKAIIADPSWAIQDTPCIVTSHGTKADNFLLFSLTFHSRTNHRSLYICAIIDVKYNGFPACNDCSVYSDYLYDQHAAEKKHKACK